MRRRAVVAATIAATLVVGVVIARSRQAPSVRSVAEGVLREYAGSYQWGQDAFLYVQMWAEFAGMNQLVAFDESGDVRTLYPTDRDRFFAGPGAAVFTATESRIEFQRDPAGRITSLTWQRDDAPPRIARRVDIELLSTCEPVAVLIGLVAHR